MRFRGAFLVLVLAALLGTSCGRGEAPASLVGYRAGDDPHRLVLVVETGPDDTLLGGKVLRQDDQAVVVEARMRQADDVQPAIAVKHEVTIDLEQPLGRREVRAPTGRPVPLLTG